VLFFGWASRGVGVVGGLVFGRGAGRGRGRGGGLCVCCHHSANSNQSPIRTQQPTTPINRQLCIAANDAAVLPATLSMLSTVGRMKYIRPLYRTLYRSKIGRQAALDCFKENAGKYHPIARKMVAADLEVV